MIAYMAIIFYLSSLSDPRLAHAAPDYFLHVAGYAALAALVARALNRGLLVTSLGLALGAVAIAFSYGVTDEIHQFFVPGRDASVYDLRSDLIGSLIGALAVYAGGLGFRRPAGARIMDEREH